MLHPLRVRFFRYHGALWNVLEWKSDRVVRAKRLRDGKEGVFVIVKSNRVVHRDGALVLLADYITERII